MWSGCDYNKKKNNLIKSSYYNLSKSTNHKIFNKWYKIVPMDDPLKKSGLIECIGGNSAEDIWNRYPFYSSPQHKYNDLVYGLSSGGEDYTRLMASAIGTFF